VKALVFAFDLKRIAWARAAGKVSERAFVGSLEPLRLREVPDPDLPGDDWVVVEPALCGICGSDTKQMFIDADFDNPLESLVSFTASGGPVAPRVRADEAARPRHPSISTGRLSRGTARHPAQGAERSDQGRVRIRTPRLSPASTTPVRSIHRG
jgi:hypothetical protein